MRLKHTSSLLTFYSPRFSAYRFWQILLNIAHETAHSERRPIASATTHSQTHSLRIRSLYTKTSRQDEAFLHTCYRYIKQTFLLFLKSQVGSWILRPSFTGQRFVAQSRARASFSALRWRAVLIVFGTWWWFGARGPRPRSRTSPDRCRWEGASCRP